MFGSNFELFVSWRYLRSRGSRGGVYVMSTGALVLILAVVCWRLGASYDGMHAFEMTDRQILLKSIFGWASLGCLLGFVLITVFGIFLALQSIFTTISTYGVFLGTAALVVVLSVMNGFESDLRRKILGSNAHILITKEDGAFTEYRDVEKKIEGLCAGRTCIVGHTAYLSSDVVVAANSNYGTVIIKGIEPKTVGAVTDLQRNISVGSLDQLWALDGDGKPVIGKTLSGEPPPRKAIDFPNDDEEPRTFDEAPPPKAKPKKDDDAEPIDFSQPGDAPVPPPLRPPPHPLRPSARVAALDGVLVGKELAKNLHLYEGQEVEIVSPVGQDTPTGQMPRVRPFRVAGVFFTGMYEYDSKMSYVTIPALQAFLSLGDEVTGIEIKISDSDRTQPVVAAVSAAIGSGYRVQDWQELNKSLFSALKLEQIAMFLVLTIIILVASFSIISNLIMVVVEKGREIATLKSIGASDWAIMRIFVAEGFFIGVLGTAFGLSIGIGTCLALKHYGLPLNSDVYYIDRLPVAMSTPAIVAIAFAGLFISIIATLYPAYVGARLRPIDGLRK